MDKTQVSAFDNLYETFAEPVFRYFAMRLSDRERALDLSQETFVRIWNAYYRQGKQITYEKALVFKVAHNLLVNAYERDKKNLSLDDMEEAGHDVADDGHLQILKESELGRAASYIERMPPPYREILLLRYVEGLSVQEIAEVIDETENVVSVRIHRGMQQLKKLYGA